MPREELLQLVEHRRFGLADRQLHLLRGEAAEEIALSVSALELQLDVVQRVLHGCIDLQQRAEVVHAREGRKQLVGQLLGNAHLALQVFTQVHDSRVIRRQVAELRVRARPG